MSASSTALSSLAAAPRRFPRVGKRRRERRRVAARVGQAREEDARPGRVGLERVRSFGASAGHLAMEYLYARNRAVAASHDGAPEPLPSAAGQPVAVAHRLRK